MFSVRTRAAQHPVCYSERAQETISEHHISLEQLIGLIKERYYAYRGTDRQTDTYLTIRNADF